MIENGEERRNLILARLRGAEKPISAIALAEECSVTRQIIVADIALLRAAGHTVRAEHRGYVLDEKDKPNGICKRIVVKHGKESVREEFYAIVDNGGKVLDVIVDHSVYGMISAKLDIATRYDADVFVSKIDETGANPLSALTEGLHVHTVRVADENAFERIVEKLTELKMYIEST